jgi:hypothetical protein
MNVWSFISTDTMNSLLRYFEIWRTNDPTGTFEMGKGHFLHIYIIDLISSFFFPQILILFD